MFADYGIFFSSGELTLLHYTLCYTCNLSLLLLLFQGFHSRPRVVPRAMHITPSTSHGSLSSALLPSQTHYHSRTLPSHRQCNGTSEERGSNESSPNTSVVDSRRRLQPVGSDSQPKISTDPSRVNGFKRSSMLLDSTGPVAGVPSLHHSIYHRSNSKGSVKSGTSITVEQSHEGTTGVDSKYQDMPFV